MPLSDAQLRERQDHPQTIGACRRSRAAKASSSRGASPDSRGTALQVFCFSTFCELSFVDPFLSIKKPRKPRRLTIRLAGAQISENLKMPFFECKISRTVLTDDLRATRVKENVYVEAKDEIEARKKAAHPLNWLRSAPTFGKGRKSSFLLTVEECRRLANDEARRIADQPLAVDAL
jgi:hypothetical protein